MTKEEIQFEMIRAKAVYPGPPGQLDHPGLFLEEALVLEKKSKLSRSERENVLKRADLIRNIELKKKDLKKVKLKDAGSTTIKVETSAASLPKKEVKK